MSRARVAPTVLASALLLVPLQPPAEAQSRGSAADTATVVRVVDAGSDRPVADADVTLTWASSSAAYQLAHVEGRSGPDGRVAFDGVPRSTNVTVAVEHDDYRTERRPLATDDETGERVVPLVRKRQHGPSEGR